MAVSLETGSILQVRLNYSQGTLRAFNILHYQVQGTTGAPASMNAALNSIGAEIYDNLKTLWAAFASEQVTFDGITSQSVFPEPRSVSVTYSPGAPQVGLIDDDALPLQDALTLLKKTDFGQRWGMGRLYVVGMPENAQDAGAAPAETELLIAPFAAELAATVTAGGVGWSVTLVPVLFQPPFVPEEGPPVPQRITPIRTVALSDRIYKTMRRRRPGKGM